MMQKTLEKFVQQLKEAGEQNLQSVILFGSAVSDDFHADFSDVNLLCVVREASISGLESLARTARQWKENPPPLIFTADELSKSLDVFPIEMLDIQQHHRVLYGQDIVENLQIPLDRHRLQLEHELRTKLLILRQHFFALAGDKSRIRSLMLDSIPSFVTLFRHTLITMGEPSPAKKRDAIRMLGQKVQFDTQPFIQLLEIREKTLKPARLDVRTTFSRYVEGIEKVIQTVDAL